MATRQPANPDLPTAGADHLVDRPALRRRLDAGLAHEHRVSLLVAPAGSGKSVLLDQWIASHPELAFARLVLTTADDDPVHFSRRLADQVARIVPEASRLGPPVAREGGGLGTGFPETLVGLLAGTRAVVVLEDLHQLSNPDVTAGIGALVAALPDGVHLALASRIDPPIAWSHSRLTRQVTELRQSDLAFDDADSARLLEVIAGRPLSADQVGALVQRTEGWAAGLQLAGITLRLRDDPDEFVAQFSGSDRLVADYLSEEVVDAQPPDRRDLLLRVSVLDELCGELVTRLTGRADAQQVLEALERESMFLVPLDDRRQWYRFHHLFRDLLRYRLRAAEPGAEAGLLERAAGWHLERGDRGPAVEYLLRARAWPRALDLIMGVGSDVFEQGQMATVVRWIHTVPEAHRADRRDVSLLLAMLTGAGGQAAASEDLLRRVCSDPAATPGERACGQSLLTTLAQFRSSPDATVEMGLAAMDMLGSLGDAPLPNVMNLSDRRSLETMTLGSTGRAHFLAGRMDDAAAWMEAGLVSAGASYSTWRIALLGSLALLEAWCGRLDRAGSLSEEALGVAGDVGAGLHPVTADAHLAAGLVELHRGRPERAEAPLETGLSRAEANRRVPLLWVCRLLLAEREAGCGRTERALSSLLAAGHHLRAPAPPLVEHGITALRSRLLRLSGRPGEAFRRLEDQPLEEPPLGIEAAASALAQHRADLATKVLGRMATAPSWNPVQAIERLLVSAWLAAVEGDRDEWHRSLTLATERGAEHGLVEVFVRAGPEICTLVADLDDQQPAFRSLVLARARVALPAPPAADLPDPLTERELEILALLPSRLTNAELAERCFVSVNTMKTHMAHIYRKLGAANRNQAITRARETGLL